MPTKSLSERAEYNRGYVEGYRSGQAETIEKLKAEIKAMFPPSGDWMYGEEYGHEHTVCEVLSDILQILDNIKKGD